MTRILILILLLFLFLTGCTSVNYEQKNTNIQNKVSVKSDEKDEKKEKESLINTDGKTVQERIKAPYGFERVAVEEDSYAQYLRSLPLKPDGSEVRLYDGRVKNNAVHAAVVDIDVGERDLQQCADAVIRLRAEYLYHRKLYDKIHFNFTNGFNADYIKWMNGNRIKVEGNKAYWTEKTGYSSEYGSFREYLNMVFAYAGTLSLSQEMKKVSLDDMRIGDVFIKGDNPGHTVIILDMAKNDVTGEKIFMIAQSYMPAQDIHILKNLQDEGLDPWYPVNFGETLSTPEWQFSKEQLMRFG
ncbi:uncharacterized protein DUF4846 [Anaerobacterium chartisolvens]|uniref:Uncharacterized protein DUF4846 n=1 Tax=Anaerobacterium chartisolvens TaxID=1297424 RepID=A0A369BIA8_9FIRM|nr:DUF4846 domain-containing protein [Anaerobacterium chartisolvens]RCX20177.1 uncharacterized protein DUF4846 [Anaerobacterium chartisolvens]